VRNVLRASEEYGMPRLRSICQAAIEGEGRALQLHPEDILQTGARSRVGLVDDLEEDGAMEDDTRLIHRVPMPLDSGLVRSLFLFFTVVNTVVNTVEKKISFLVIRKNHCCEHTVEKKKFFFSDSFLFSEMFVDFWTDFAQFYLFCREFRNCRHRICSKP
jgi:hypothetical protein